ncbi:formyltetrahydrofolate deformylase [Burkholderia sp. FERM BP-3421]|uniref:formyltetrahydrofolate deformylase n=1 Tax=Burkholderia sp. FERM BP-3421 TaxID=1494466 RepID=UPI002361CB7C|nr:formyltetrahydrofolate deformylase [Burkholderia sp. FERM BP-3421]WDD93723.1 formyltetrahydrofolate deformylase [Burkholderia sp. FERM BP-3421]
MAEPPAGVEYALLASCPAQRGLLHRVSSVLAELGGHVLDSAQYSDPASRRLFMRIVFALDEGGASEAALRAGIGRLEDGSGLQWTLYATAARPRVLLLASRLGHCLNDLLFRHASGTLPVEVVGVVSNHRDFARLVDGYNLPFHHFPLPPHASAEERAEQEQRILALVDAQDIELVVLARYMQILSPQFCDALKGRVINIHHSFLPSFKGAQPYGQAHARGVKLIGATAHFVTRELDEGPIIEQDVARIDHAMSPQALATIGGDAECVVLARAVKWFAERRILLNGNKTVVFR